MVETIYSVQDGPQITVSELLGMPTAIAKPMVDYLTDWDLSKQLFRDGGTNNGSVLYEKDAAPFAAHGLETVAEFSEIPTTRGVAGSKVVAIAEKEGRALEISYEMEQENRQNTVATLIQQMKNSALLSSTRRIKDVLTASDIPSVAASKAWTDPTADIIGDSMSAIEEIADAAVPGYEDDEATFDFEPDTMIVPRSMVGHFSKNENVRAVWVWAISRTRIPSTRDSLGSGSLASTLWFRSSGTRIGFW